MIIREQLAQASRAKFITVAEACLLVRCSPKTIWRRVRSGEIRGILRIGHKLRLPRAAVLQSFRRKAQ